MPGFTLDNVEDNHEGWGPTSVPEQFKIVPFLPYGKGERIGRIADFASIGRGHYHRGAYFYGYRGCRLHSNQSQASKPALFLIPQWSKRIVY